MPKTIKERLISDICFNYALDSIVLSSSDEEEEQADQFNCMTQLLISHKRIDQAMVPKSRPWYKRILIKYDDGRFRQMLRVNPEEFAHILILIKDDPVFKNKNCVQQIPVELQLQITLFRLGSSGESASVRKIASRFAIGDGGTLNLITKRVLAAILNLKTKFLTWPSELERSKIVAKTINELPGCIGYVDGSEIKLAEAPVKRHELYYSRKRQYAIKKQAICDYKLRIRHAVIGHPGSVHDAKVFSQSAISKSPINFFSNSQWIAGDSAYPLKSYLVPPFRQNSNQFTKAKRDLFNSYFSRYRVRIENCFGKLKEKFCSLKELRFRFQKDDSRTECNEWIMACCILHNILIEFNDTEEESTNEVPLRIPLEMSSSQDVRTCLVNFICNH